MYITMKYNYAEAIKKALNDMMLMFKSRKDDDETRFEVFMPSDRIPVLRIKLIIDERGDTKLRCYLASGVSPGNVPALKEEINRLNAQYRFICLSLDEDRNLSAANDFILFGDEENAAKQAITTLILFADITDKCVPTLMPLTWREEWNKDNTEKVKTNLFGNEGVK